MYLINLILQFWSRKIFLYYLGTEILGLNTTATNILQFLNLAELGISSAIAFSLYKPLFENDKDTINEIITLQGHIYKRIAIGIIAGAIVIMLFFPWIFHKMRLPLWYAYLSFSVLLFSSLLGYFVNYKQVILAANQDEYKINLSYKSILIIKTCVQMVCISQLNNGYIWWAILEIVFACIASLSLHLVTKYYFPYLNTATQDFKVLRKKYKIIETKIKQLFFHKSAVFALSQTIPLVLYAYANLNDVSYYQNYMLVYMGLISLMSAIFNGITASVGNVSAENPKRLIVVFRELFSTRFFFSIVISYSFYILTPGFISLWIGEMYVLPKITVLLISIMLFIALSRQTVENFLQSLGMFQDIWAPITEFVLNVSLSLLFGFFWGLNGIILGVLASLCIIVLGWKPYFLYRCGLNQSINKYIEIYIIHISVSAGLITLFQLLLTPIINISFENWQIFIAKSLIFITSFSGILLIMMVITKCDIRFTIKRIQNLISKKI